MTAWPDTLPGPLRQISVTPGSNTEAMEQASGRRIVRNWGHDTADRVAVQFRIKQTQEEEFKDFWHRVGMDVTWFTAYWLPSLRYPNHIARLLGYPRRKGLTSVWIDFAVTLLIMPLGAVADGVPWLSAGTGTILPPPPDESYFALSHFTSPFISVYKLFEGDGVFGTKIPDPASLPSAQGTGVVFSPEVDAIVIAHQSTPFVAAYPWAAGFGTKYSNPGTLPSSTPHDVAFTTEGDYVAIGHNGLPYVSVYPWAAGFGTKVSDPASLPVGLVNGVAFTPESDYIALVHSSSPYIAIYPWSGGFGTKVSDPASLPGAISKRVTFSPDGTVVAVAHNASGGIWLSAYPWSDGFGTKYSDPSSLPSGQGVGVAFTPDGDHIAGVSTGGTTRVAVYQWVAGFGTKTSDLGSVSVSGDVEFSPSGNYMAVATSASPFFNMYTWTDTFGLGSKLASPTTPPASTGLSVAFGLVPS